MALFCCMYAFKSMLLLLLLLFLHKSELDYYTQMHQNLKCAESAES